MMKREEILEKSRKANKDEGMEYAENQGRKAGFIAIALLCMFISVFALFYGESSTIHVTSSLIWAFMATEAYSKYRFLKSRLYLAATVAGSIASILSVINYVHVTLR